MKTRTSELKGAALDWAVAKALFGVSLEVRLNGYGYWVMPLLEGSYHSDWAHGGPIIERECITVAWNSYLKQWRAVYENGKSAWGGTSPLVAAMRCFVASKLGDEVEAPEELA